MGGDTVKKSSSTTATNASSNTNHAKKEQMYPTGKATENGSANLEELKLAPTNDEVSEASSTAADFSLDIDFGGTKRVLNYIWTLLLGLAGLLDLLACVLPQYVNPASSGQDADLDGFMDPVEASTFLYAEELQHFVEWLDVHDVTIGFIFSGMWFLDAFVAAQGKRHRALVKQERQRLHVDKDEGMEAIGFWGKPLVIYYRTIFIQMLLLPVGFYFSLFIIFDRVMRGRQLDALEDANDEIVIDMVNDEGTQFGHEVFSASSKITLAFAIIQHVWLKSTGTALRIVKSRMVETKRTAVPKFLRYILGNAIWHPIKFKKTISKLLRTLRWVKYLAPLIGTLNKLKGNIEDMMRKYRQHQQAQFSKRIRQKLWKTMDPSELREAAAIRLQSAYRAYIGRKTSHAMKLLTGSTKEFAILRVQQALRRRLAKARVVLMKKSTELKRLESMQTSKISDKEKKRLYELQDELAGTAKTLINRKLLLRPNTKFAVIWKLLFIGCITIEIMQLISKPVSAHLRKKYKADKKTSDAVYVSHQLVPDPVSKWASCQISHTSNASKEGQILLPWYCRQPYADIQETGRDLLALAFVPSKVSTWKQCAPQQKNMLQRAASVWKRNKEAPSMPWYCGEPTMWLHACYRTVVDFMFNQFLVLVSIVCILDVFVTFFTGEFDEANGLLVPKPFVTRWLMPGLVLQLVVNPKMDSISSVVSDLTSKMLSYGPIRVLRWAVAVVFPFVYGTFVLVLHHLWIPAVQFENQNRVLAGTVF